MGGGPFVLKFVTKSHRTGFGELVIPKPVESFQLAIKKATFSHKMLSLSS